jgi:iron complex outermembrane receptor protein
VNGFDFVLPAAIISPHAPAGGPDEEGRMRRTVALAAVAAASFTLAARAVPFDNLAELDLEALCDVKVSLPSRHEEPLLTTPAAVYVIGREDLVRSGVTTLPDALRMAPGLQVAQMDANKWAITARGFDGRFARYMLVQLDGRSVYTPMFSGVFWEAQDMLLQDVDHIEVVRGPGGAMWGANAVNGVVNVVTRSAKETQGLFFEAGGGTEESGFFGARIGEKAGPDTYVRVYVKGFERDGGDAHGMPGADDWRALQAGFRLDCEQGRGDTLTLSGDSYSGRAGQRLTVPDALVGARSFEDEASYSGGNILLRWRARTGHDSDFTLSSYADETRRSEYAFDETRRTWDLDMQQHVRDLGRHDLLWGAGYRGTRDRMPPTPLQTCTPESQQDSLYGAFAQDTMALWPHRVSLTAGSKVEHNDYSGWEVQPNVRLAYTPSACQTWWAAASRAVRTPSRVESTIRLNCLMQRPNMTFMGQPQLPAELNADGQFGSETVTACELGCRMQPLDSLILDVATFYNSYKDLQSVEPVSAEIPVRFVLRNNMEGEAFGAEAALYWKVLPWWVLQLSCSYMDLHLSADPNSRDIFTERTYEEDVPHRQASFLSRWNLPGGVQLDGWLRYVDPIPIEAIPSYLEMDLRATCPLGRNVDVTIAGRNLLHDSHAEYGPSFLIATETTAVERSAYAKLTYWLR